jgi:hypothetical protein
MGRTSRRVKNGAKRPRTRCRGGNVCSYCRIFRNTRVGRVTGQIIIILHFAASYFIIEYRPVNATWFIYCVGLARQDNQAMGYAEWANVTEFRALTSQLSSSLAQWIGTLYSLGTITGFVHLYSILAANSYYRPLTTRRFEYGS